MLIEIANRHVRVSHISTVEIKVSSYGPTTEDGTYMVTLTLSNGQTICGPVENLKKAKKRRDDIVRHINKEK